MISRRVAGLVSAFLTVSSAVAHAQVVTVKTGSVAPEGTPWSEWLDGVKARIEKDAAGKVKMKNYLGGKLGGEKEMVDEVKNGTLQIFGGSAAAMGGFVPEMGVFELPFIFASDAEADFVLDRMREPVSKLLSDKGFTMIMWAENGWHGYGVKGKCVTQPDELKGLKMRSQESFIHIETYKALGASPVEMAVPEVLGSLQTGTVDGYSNTPLFSFATSWYNGITHFTYTKHIYQPGILVASKKWLDTQAPEIRTAIQRRDDERAGIEGVRALTEPLLDNFKAAKKTVCRLTPDATKAFSDKARGVWEIFGKRSAANKAILDQVLAAKKDFAAKKK